MRLDLVARVMRTTMLGLAAAVATGCMPAGASAQSTAPVRLAGGSVGHAGIQVSMMSVGSRFDYRVTATAICGRKRLEFPLTMRGTFTPQAGAASAPAARRDQTCLPSAGTSTRGSDSRAT
jgi:hypothetical protein